MVALSSSSSLFSGFSVASYTYGKSGRESELVLSSASISFTISTCFGASTGSNCSLSLGGSGLVASCNSNNVSATSKTPGSLSLTVCSVAPIREGVKSCFDSTVAWLTTGGVMLVVKNRDSAGSCSVTSVSGVSNHSISVVATSCDGVGSSSRAWRADLLSAASFISKKSISSPLAGTRFSISVGMCIWVDSIAVSLTVSFSFVVTIRVWLVSVLGNMRLGLIMSAFLVASSVGTNRVPLDSVVGGIMFVVFSFPGNFAGLAMSCMVSVLEASVRFLFGVISTRGVATTRAGTVGR